MFVKRKIVGYACEYYGMRRNVEQQRFKFVHISIRSDGDKNDSSDGDNAWWLMTMMMVIVQDDDGDNGDDDCDDCDVDRVDDMLMSCLIETLSYLQATAIIVHVFLFAVDFEMQQEDTLSSFLLQYTSP